MVSYRLVFKKSVTKDLHALPNNAVKQILKRIDLLREAPRGVGCIKLSSQERYRVRQGCYRIIYEIKDTELIITVVKVAHRKDVYRDS